MSHPIGRVAARAVLIWLCAAAAAAQPSPPTPTDLDAFMKEVLAHRDDNRLLLQQYILDEVERFRVLGPGRTPLFGRERDFAWYVRDGLHVRSPVRIDGVAVGGDDREAFEQDWMREERARLARRAEKKGEPAPAPTDAAAATPGSGNLPIAAPRFVSEAYFLDFKFEPGNYFLAGREALDGRQVLRIEYYPRQMFRDGPDDDDAQRERRRRRQDDEERQREEAIERKLNKTALITLWIDPAERQIVKYTFDNVWMDFLPGAWLARVDDVHASMVMSQPFPNVWLPRDLQVDAAFSLATGVFEVRYDRAFADYRLAETKTTIRVPKEASWSPRRTGPVVPGILLASLLAIAVPTGGTAAEDRVADGQTEVVREVRVHGNVTVPDDQVLRMAGIAIGQPLDARGIDDLTARLRRSGVFDSVEVRKRFRSLDSTTDVALILVVHEKAGVTVTESGEIRKPGPADRLTSRLQFLPILGYDDGYGWTYGARVSATGLLGAREHLSVPLSWGATRRAALEAQRTFDRGPFTTLEGSVGISQRENPHFHLDDRRSGVWGRAERRFLNVLRAGVSGGRERVEFGGDPDGLSTVGADLGLDTRQDPAFPRNAVRLRGGWTGLYFGGTPGRIDRLEAGARGYLGLVGQAVLAGRIDYLGASDVLPPSERLLLGGWSTLRGTPAGAIDGDRRLVTSAEVRVPLTSVMSGSKLGVLGFYDHAVAWDVTSRLADTGWRSGAGGGVFLIAPFVTLTLDVAHGFPDGDTRVHFGTGFSF